MLRIVLADPIVVADEHGSALSKQASISTHTAAKRLLLNLRLIEIETVLTRARLILQALPLRAHMQATQVPLAHMRRVVASALEEFGNSRRRLGQPAIPIIEVLRNAEPQRKWRTS